MNNQSGSWWNNFTGPLVAVIVGFFVWPMLIPFNGLGTNYMHISPWNWILEVIWLLVLALGWSFRQGYRETGQEEVGTIQDQQVSDLQGYRPPNDLEKTLPQGLTD